MNPAEKILDAILEYRTRVKRAEEKLIEYDRKKAKAKLKKSEILRVPGCGEASKARPAEDF